MNPIAMLQNLMNKNINVKNLAHQYAQQLNNPVVNNLINQLDNGNQEEANKIINNLMQQNGMSERFEEFKKAFSKR